MQEKENNIIEHFKPEIEKIYKNKEKKFDFQKNKNELKKILTIPLNTKNKIYRIEETITNIIANIRIVNFKVNTKEDIEELHDFLKKYYKSKDLILNKITFIYCSFNKLENYNFSKL